MQDNKNTFALIAGGTINDYTVIAPLIKNYFITIAVDAGLHHCHKMNICPDIIIGDCDSVSREILNCYSHVPVHKHPVDKDLTDTELAFEYALHASAEKMTLFGGLGTRTDHSLSNIYLISKHPKKAYIETENEILFSLEGSNEIKCFKGQTIGLIPLEKTEGITTKGLKWELSNATFDKAFMSVSNICLDQSVGIEIKRGSLLCCLQKGHPL